MRTSQDYERAKRYGRRSRAKHFGVNVLMNGLDFHRLGLVVQKRFWSSVLRNRIKRLLREWFRMHKSEIPPPGKDIVLIARPGAEKLTFREIARELGGALSREDGRRS